MSELSIGAERLKQERRRAIGRTVVAALAAMLIVVLLALQRCHPATPPLPSPPPRGNHFVKSVDASEFQKGNLHTHSNVSDGDSPPESVYLWYREHGYNFAALTDHNTLVDRSQFAFLERPDFRILPGEEITMSGNGLQVHVNALCIDHTIEGGGFATARLALDHATNAIDSQHGVALINHPNFDFGLTADDVAPTHAALLEVWSGHPYVWTLGKDGRPSHEHVWDIALSKGADMAPAGVDDTHQFLDNTSDRKPARPGVAWVQVFANSPDSQTICDRLRRGDLYASNGAELERLVVDGETMSVWPDAQATVHFIGQDGRELATAPATPSAAAIYTLRGDETYVRARVEDQHGKLAFTNAYRVEAR